MIELALVFVFAVGVGWFIRQFVWWRRHARPIDRALLVGAAVDSCKRQYELFENQRIGYEATSQLIETMNGSNAKLVKALEPLEIAARDWANVERLPVEAQARCLSCKASTSIAVSKLRGINCYEIIVPEGWRIEQDLASTSMAVFLFCPTCRPQYEDLIRKTVEPPVE